LRIIFYLFSKVETYISLPSYYISSQKQKDIMKGYLGEFEELVLLTIANLDSEAYGLALLRDINERANRNLSIGAMHSTLTRLEEKGFITSYQGEPTKERGGRRKRYFELTSDAISALTQMKSLRDDLWANPKVKLSIG
jgi:DNA-binding PadR family transcriptional regulator